jgi:anti-sigma factor RsiW
MTPPSHLSGEVLSAYLDGELRSGELELLVNHLPGCERCIGEFRHLREARAWLRTLPELEVPDRVVRSIHYGPELSAYLDGELGSVEQPEVTAHLATCGLCRDELQQLDAARAAIRSLPRLEPPPAPAAKVSEIGHRRRWRVVTAAAGIAAAAVIVLGVVASEPDEPATIDLDSFADRHVARASVEPGFAVIPAVGPTRGTP